MACPGVHGGDVDIGQYLSELSAECRPCASAIAMFCSTTVSNQDCAVCAEQFERNEGCPILRSGQDLAPYFPPGCLSCVIEIGMKCAPPASEDDAPIALTQGADCAQCVIEYGSTSCEALLREDQGSMANFIDTSCLSCSTAILESCATEEVSELENFDCDRLDPGDGIYQDCARGFAEKNGCDIMLRGENPISVLDRGCRGCVAEAGMHCVLRRPAFQPMRSVPEILLDRGITKVWVVGLVYDFCVSETAIFGMQGLSLWTDFEGNTEGGITPEVVREQGYYGVTVLTDLTRPSFDGKPGAPFTAGICDGPDDPENPAFCTEGGGTLPSFQRWKTEMEAVGVNVSRRADVDCTHIRPMI